MQTSEPLVTHPPRSVRAPIVANAYVVPLAIFQIRHSHTSETNEDAGRAATGYNRAMVWP